jgi:hypothetical protein
MKFMQDYQAHMQEEFARSASACRDLVEIDEPMPICRSVRKTKVAKRGNAKARSKPRNESVDDSTESISPELQDRIYHAAASSRAAAALEGDVAKTVLEHLSAFSEIVGFNQKFMRHNNNQTLGELDLHLDNAIVECTLRSRGKQEQLTKYLTDRTINPQDKAVILYGENYVGHVPAGVHIARNPEQLADKLFALKAQERGWLKPR